ncbi:hypothetical protein THOM_0093 [Trachipleistophora hominis]|uniref:Uncharacterized protein n=1 Tax=Trachipleistophora hominis TaxID=72359 RepID=L7K0K6_TRAHO|nr:hypothetical protein THOM_0093 [Trachipleistophora hominis]
MSVTLPQRLTSAIMFGWLVGVYPNMVIFSGAFDGDGWVVVDWMVVWGMRDGLDGDFFWVVVWWKKEWWNVLSAMKGGKI